MKKEILIGIAVIFALLPGCKSERKIASDLAQIRKIIEIQNTKWLTAIETYDITALLSIYTDDAILLPPNRPMIKGKREIKAYYDRMPNRGIKITKGGLTTLELSGNDSTVYEIGQYCLSIEREGKPVLSDTGKYSTIWRLESDSIWKIYADCWNSSNPLRLMQSNK